MATRQTRTPGAFAQPQAAEPAAADPNEPTLNAADVDAKTITAPVLTRQGWVVPDEEHLRNQRAVADAKRKLGID